MAGKSYRMRRSLLQVCNMLVSASKVTLWRVRPGPRLSLRRATGSTDEEARSPEGSGVNPSRRAGISQTSACPSAPETRGSKRIREQGSSHVQ